MVDGQNTMLTLNLLTTTIVAPPSNASKWQMGFNSAFKGLILFYQHMHFYLTYKILSIKIYIKTLFYSHSYMFRSVQTIIRESILSLAKVTFL